MYWNIYASSGNPRAVLCASFSNDLDAPGTLRGDSREQAAVDALAVGVDWLLVAGTPDLPDLVDAVVEAVTMEHLPSARVHSAAQAVRTLTGDIG